MRAIRTGFIAAALLWTGLAGAAGVAFLADVKGEVTLDGGARAAILAELAKGQKVVLGKDAQAAVMYVASGKEFVLRGPGNYEVGDSEVTGQGAPPAARATEWRANGKVLAQAAQTSAASVRMRSIAVPKAPPAERLIFPTQGAVSTLQPVFRWATSDPKAEFTLSVVGQPKPVHAAKVSGSTHKAPGKLKPDTEYIWVVAAGTGEVGTGTFRTLPAEAVQRLEKRRPAPGKSEFSDRLNYALLLQETGALQEAQEAFAQLARDRPDLPELAALAK